MTNPNFSPCPSSFPNEGQRVLISTYSSLANALGTNPRLGYTTRQGPRSHPEDCDVVLDKPTIYLDRPPVNNPSYPYPARSVFNPDTYPTRTPLSVSNGRHPNTESAARSENVDQNDLTRLPPRYDRLPQPVFVETGMPHGYQPRSGFPAIHFRRKGNKLPYTLSDLLTMNTMPDLVAGDTPIALQSPGCMLKIKLIWPGYSHYPFEKRIITKRGAALTPTLLLTILANHMQEFVRWLQNESAVVEPGHEQWAVTRVPDGAPALWKSCTIVSLQHRTGSVWQPEIYYLKG